MTPLELAALRAKYEEMLRLRRLAEDGDEGDPRGAMAALAARFPGALREIDELPMDAIRGRIDELDRAEHGAPVAPWMRATHLFHAMTRGALCAKKWLAGRRDVGPEAREAFLREATALGLRDDALPWASELARLASPPRGRLTELVYVRVGETLGVGAAEVRALVFPTSTARRRARAH